MRYWKISINDGNVVIHHFEEFLQRGLEFLDDGRVIMRTTIQNEHGTISYICSPCVQRGPIVRSTKVRYVGVEDQRIISNEGDVEQRMCTAARLKNGVRVRLLSHGHSNRISIKHPRDDGFMEGKGCGIADDEEIPSSHHATKLVTRHRSLWMRRDARLIVRPLVPQSGSIASSNSRFVADDTAFVILSVETYERKGSFCLWGRISPRIPRMRQ